MPSNIDFKFVFPGAEDVDDIYSIETHSLQRYEVYSKDVIKTNLENYFNVLVKKNGSSIGYIVFSFYEEEAELLKICVLPGFQRTGVGSKLLKYAIDLLAEKNVKEIFLEVCENNYKAVNFYEKFGFKRISLRKNYYENGTNAIIMKYIIL